MITSREKVQCVLWYIEIFSETHTHKILEKIMRAKQESHHLGFLFVNGTTKNDGNIQVSFKIL